MTGPDLRTWALEETTWDPSEATDISDGKPDSAIVPFIEGLLENGVHTYQSCSGHHLEGGARRSAGIWFNYPGFDPHAAARSDHIDEVARLYGREEIPVWSVKFPGLGESSVSFEKSLTALWETLGLDGEPVITKINEP